MQDFQEEQDLVARLIHRLRSSGPSASTSQCCAQRGSASLWEALAG